MELTLQMDSLKKNITLTLIGIRSVLMVIDWKEKN